MKAISRSVTEKEGTLTIHPLNITYERRLPLIHDLPNFKWPAPIQTDLSQRNPSVRCDYHKDHEHETNKCRSLKFLVKRLIKAGNLRRYVREVDRGAESGPTTYRITASMAALLESRPTINYILGGPFDEQNKSKRQQKKLLKAAIVKAQVNSIHTGGSLEETKQIDGPISFPSVNRNRVIMMHLYSPYVLVVLMCIGCW